MKVKGTVYLSGRSDFKTGRNNCAAQVLNEEHLKRLLKEFIEGYYHRARPHQGLHGDTPVPSAKTEPVADASRLVSIPVVGGLHHRYIRVAA